MLCKPHEKKLETETSRERAQVDAGSQLSSSRSPGKRQTVSGLARKETLGLTGVRTVVEATGLDAVEVESLGG